jgi:hypothetical protein
MAQKLYDMAVMHHPLPTEDEHKRGVKPKSAVIVAPKTIVATDDKEAAILAAREIPAEYLDKLESVEVLVRPF